MKQLRATRPRGRLASRRPLGSRSQDPLIRDWLTHAHSLTARIRTRCDRFAVRVLHQGRGAPLPGERAWLPGLRTAHVREVVLLADGVAVVWARTVLPHRALRGAWRFLAGLGSRPLGERLFTDPAIARTPFSFLPGNVLTHARIPKAGTPLPPGRPATCVAARSAMLRRGGQCALLTEVLLPAVRGLAPAPVLRSSLHSAMD